MMDDIKALQYDRCMSSDAWKCADCLNSLKQDVWLLSLRYEYMVCKNCEKLIISKQDTAACHSDHLITIIEKLMERYEKFDNQLENKIVRQRSL